MIKTLHLGRYTRHADATSVFPKDICIKSIDMNQALPTLYYGNDMAIEGLILNVTVVILNQKQLTDFNAFYYGELNYGVNPFKMLLPLVGLPREYDVHITSDIGTTIEDGLYPREYVLPLRVIGEFYDASQALRFQVLLGVGGGTISFTVDNEVTVDWGDGAGQKYAAGTITGQPFGTASISSLKPITLFNMVGTYIDTVNIVKGMDLIDATDMCKDLDSMYLFKATDMPNLKTTDGMFKGTTNMARVPHVDLTHVTSGIGMFEGSGILEADLDTSNIEVFTNFFKNANHLQCLRAMDTRKQTDTTGMFTGTGDLVRPTLAEQATIEAGALWVNDIACSSVVSTFLQYLLYDKTNIATEFEHLTNVSTLRGELTAELDDGHAETRPLPVNDLSKKMIELRSADKPFESSTLYDNVSESTAPDTLVTVPALVVGNRMVIATDDDKLHQVDITTLDGNGAANVSAITNGEVPRRAFIISTKIAFDLGSGFQDAVMVNEHYSLDALELELPAPTSGSTINLKDFIEANNPNHQTNIIITNNHTQPKIATGDLYGYTVTFVNTGEIQGNGNSATALEVTSPLTLFNSGSIMGAGGAGGKGGRGGRGGYGGKGANGAAGTTASRSAYVSSSNGFFNLLSQFWISNEASSSNKVKLKASGNDTYGNYWICDYTSGELGTGTIKNNIISPVAGAVGSNVTFKLSRGSFKQYQLGVFKLYYVKWQVLFNAIGGAGGAGGSRHTGGYGGSGCSGGRGQQYGHSAGSGHCAGMGGTRAGYHGGKRGHDPIIKGGRAGSDGSDGGSGGNGGAGGYGGAGGSWGHSGGKGATGSRGTDGKVGKGTGGEAGGSAFNGSGGAGGGRAGHSITGTHFLTPDSNQGTLIGTTTA